MAAVTARTGALNKMAGKAAQRPVAAVRRAPAARAAAAGGMAHFTDLATPFDNYKFRPIKEATVGFSVVRSSAPAPSAALLRLLS
jgi:hypothetical protein